MQIHVHHFCFEAAISAWLKGMSIALGFCPRTPASFCRATPDFGAGSGSLLKGPDWSRHSNERVFRDDLDLTPQLGSGYTGSLEKSISLNLCLIGVESLDRKLEAFRWAVIRQTHTKYGVRMRRKRSRKDSWPITSRGSPIRQRAHYNMQGRWRGRPCERRWLERRLIGHPVQLASAMASLQLATESR